MKLNVANRKLLQKLRLFILGYVWLINNLEMALNIRNILIGNLRVLQPLISGARCENFHTTTPANAWMSDSNGPKNWLKYNEKIYPPQAPGEEPRPAVSLRNNLNIIIVVNSTYSLYAINAQILNTAPGRCGILLL